MRALTLKQQQKTETALQIFLELLDTEVLFAVIQVFRFLSIHLINFVFFLRFQKTIKMISYSQLNTIVIETLDLFTIKVVKKIWLYSILFR